jgi:hypothetical protein
VSGLGGGETLAVSAGKPVVGNVYVRVSPTSWDRKKNTPERAAFYLRTGKQMFSVYRADMQTPRGVLQLCINDQKQRLNSTDPDARQRSQDFLDREGNTVEELVANGWQVVRLPDSAFTDLGFTLLEPEPDGHQNVVGQREDFKMHARALIQKCERVPSDQCLTG